MTLFECFAGIGGFRLGLERAGFRCVGACELDKYAATLYQAFYKTSQKGEYFENDIRQIKPENLPNFDLLCGGFPCQAFSIAGKQRGFKDERGVLFFELIRLARAKRPKILFFENVKGLLSHEGGATFSYILAEISQLGYSVEFAVLNSKDYGLPQHRERLFIIGILRGRSGGEILPILKELAEAKNEARLQRLGTIGKDSQGSRVYDSKGLSITLKASGGGAGAKTGLYLVGQRVRRLTAKEALRVQGFSKPINRGLKFDDDLYKLAKSLNISDTQLYKMAGNAVSVSVIEAIAWALRAKFKGLQDEF